MPPVILINKILLFLVCLTIFFGALTGFLLYLRKNNIWQTGLRKAESDILRILSTGVLALAFLALIFVGYRWIIIYRDEYSSKLKELESEKVLSQIKITEWEKYENEQYGFKINYPKNWTYSERLPRKVTYNFQYGDKRSMKTMTDFEVFFEADRQVSSLDRIHVVSYFGAGPIFVRIFDGNMEEKADMEKRNHGDSWLLKRKEDKYEFRNGISAVKLVSDYGIPDSNRNYTETEIRFEKNNKTFSIILDDLKDREAGIFRDAYWNMVDYFEFIKK
jgi:hypothetical protein